MKTVYGSFLNAAVLCTVMCDAAVSAQAQDDVMDTLRMLESDSE